MMGRTVAMAVEMRRTAEGRRMQADALDALREEYRATVGKPDDDAVMDDADALAYEPCPPACCCDWCTDRRTVAEVEVWETARFLPGDQVWHAVLGVWGEVLGVGPAPWLAVRLVGVRPEYVGPVFQQWHQGLVRFTADA